LLKIELDLLKIELADRVTRASDCAARGAKAR